MKLAIVGSRGFTDTVLGKSIINDFCEIWYPDTIVSGGAAGADTMGKQFAFEHGMDYIEHLPNWKAQGKAAGMIRNSLIVEDCDQALVFWDYRSPGTRSTINLLWCANKKAMVYDYVNDIFHSIVPRRYEFYEEKVLAKARGL